MHCAWLWLALGCRAAPDGELHDPPRVAAPAEWSAPAPPTAPASTGSTLPARPSATLPEAQDQAPPLSGAWLEQLGDNALGAVVTLPLGTRAPRPLIVGVHGAGDRPEWSCGGWRLASDSKFFVVCPRGSKMDSERFAWTTSAAIERALLAALTEVHGRYARYLSDAPGIYAGFSQGATLAEPILRARAKQFPISILAEGGYAFSQSAAFARAYHESGGRRVVLVCGSPACFASAARAKTVLERAALQVLIVGDPQAGHNLNERMQVALRKAWPDISAPLARD